MNLHYLGVLCPEIRRDLWNASFTASKPSAQPRDIGVRCGERKHPRNAETDAARAQVATNGSPHPRVLNPGPSSPRAGDRNAAHPPQEKAAAVTRARGTAAAQPPQPPQGPGETLPAEGTGFRCLRDVFLPANRNFSDKKKSEREVVGQLCFWSGLTVDTHVAPPVDFRNRF